MRKALIAGVAAPLLAIPTGAFAATAPNPVVDGSSATGTSSTQQSTPSDPTGTTGTTSPSGSTAPAADPGNGSTAAPPGTSEAYAANVDGVVAVSHTKASSDGSKGKATADPLELGGSPVVGGSGDSGSKAKADGNLLGNGPTPITSGDNNLLVALAPWSYDTTATTANAYSSLATVILGGAVYLDVLHSESHATYDPTANTSSGHTESHGVHLMLGSDKATNDGTECSDNSCVSLYLLYATTDTSGKGTGTQVANLNGMGIVTNKDVGGNCVIPADPLLHVVCVDATGGAGKAAQSSVATATSQSGLPEVDLVSGNATPAGASAAHVTGDTTQVQGEKMTKPAAPAASTGSGNLPFTGFNAGLAALVGLVTAGAGIALRRVRRAPAA